MANTTYDTIKNMKPAPWSRSTVADGNALNQNFLEPTHQKDLTLADAIDQVKNTVDGYNEIINNISNVADTAKSQAANAISAANEAQNDVEALQTTVTEMSAAVTEHGESIETLGNNFNTLSAAVASEAEAISNLQNNKQDKIYVDANTISGNGTENSPYTVIGGNQKELEFVDSTTVTVHKDEQDDKIIYSFSAAGGGGGGTSYDMAWYPTVDTDGNIAWEWNRTTTAPTTTNIKGPQGERGPTGPQGISGNKGNDATPITATTAAIASGTQVTISYTSGGDPLAQFNVLSGAQGASGAKGDNGFSPTVATATTAAGDKTGTKITFTYFDSEGTQQTESYIAWNGIDGQGATVNLLEGDGIQITHAAGTTNYTIGVSADYTTKPTEGNKIFVYQTTGTTTSGWEAIPIEYDVAKRNFAIGVENKFVSAGGGNNILLHGYQNSGSYVDFAQGYQNSAYQYGISQGYQNIANYESMAQGYINTAVNISLAQGSTNSANYQAFAQGILNRAYYDSLAQGHKNSAVEQSFAQGLENTAYHYSFAQGYDNIAYFQSFTQGANNIASDYSQAIGHNLIASGFKVDDYDYGLFAIGGYNATTSNALFVIGNGNSYNGTPSRSDAFVVYQDGHVSAAGDIWANGIKLGSGGSFTGVTTAGSISGDGLTNPLGLKTSAEQALVAVSSKLDKTVWDETSGRFLQSVNTNNAVSGDGSTNRPIGLDRSVSSQLSKIDNKSTVTSGAGHNLSFRDGTNSNPITNFDFSAVDYMRNLSVTAYAPQRLVVVTSDDDIINNHATYSEGIYGTIFFVTSAHV